LCIGWEWSVRCQKYIDQDNIGQNCLINRFEISIRFVCKEVTVRVKLGLGAGIQLPDRRKAQCPATGKNDAEKSKQENKYDDDPITPMVLAGFFICWHW